MAQFLILGSSAEIRYGTGQISGFFSQDYVKVGDLIVLTRILLKQLESISVGKVSPIWYNMLNQHLLAQPTEIGDVLIDRKTTEFCASKCSAIDDSGTSLLAGPTGAIAQINHAIGAVGVVNQECKAVVAQYGKTILDKLINESVVDKTIEKTSYSWNDAGCTACEMAVVWIKNPLRLNETEDQILDYANALCDMLPSPNGESVVECSTLSEMPNVSFTIGGKVFELSPEQE
ncbi:Aspartic proteinase [Glycine max]|nr:Aspartic proteinase [Glycine max]